MKEIRIEWQEYDEGGKPVAWIDHRTLVVDDTIELGEANRRLAAAGLGERVRVLELGTLDVSGPTEIEAALNECIAAHFDDWPEANLGAIEAREAARLEAMNARKLDRLEKKLESVVDLVKGLAEIIATGGGHTPTVPPPAKFTPDRDRVSAVTYTSQEDRQELDRKRPAMRVSYATWTAMSESDREQAIAGFDLTIEDASGGEIRAAPPSSSSREPEVSLAVDETVVPPRMLKQDGSPAIPVLGKDGVVRGERAGSGAVANVESKGWGIAGPSAKAEIERIGPDGSITKEKLPTVGDTLRAPRSNW